MSAKSSEDQLQVRLPRETTALFGHGAAEATLLAAYRSGRIAHAWLIGGAHGIGKATLAYRMARFVLANPDPASAAVQAADSLHVDPEHPVARQIAGGSHGGLLTLERSANDKGVMRTVITVDELNANAANALLKVLEEPPERALFLLLSHAAARVLPTIQSRCRRLPLRPLTTDQVADAVAASAGLDRDDSALAAAAEASEGSAARALMLIAGDALGLHQRTAALLATLPHVDQRALHALGDALGGSDRTAIATFVDTIDRWMSERLKVVDANANLPRLARLAEVWEKINRAARETESFNLERKPLVFSVFGLLADVTR